MRTLMRLLTAAPVSIDPCVLASPGMKPYSKDLRLRVLAAVDSGEPREQLAKAFSMSMPTIKRWLKRRPETGDVEPEPIPGRPSRKGAMLQSWLPKHLQANDDLTLEEH